MNMRRLFSAGLLITLGMVTGRVLGLLREALVAANFGSGTDADMAIGLLIIPDFITMLLIGSAASATLVPAFSSRNQQEASALFFQSMAASVCVASIAAILAFWQLQAVYPEQYFALLMAMASLPLSAANAVCVAWLQYKDRLRIPAFSNAIFNAVVVLGLWLIASGIHMLGVVIFLAASLRLGVHVIGVVLGRDLVLSDTRSRQLTRDVLKNYTSTVCTGFFGIVPQYAPYAVLALSASGVALFNYAFKLVLLPAMLIATVIQMVCLQWFVRLNKEGVLQQSIPLAFQLGLVVSLSISLCVMLASQHIAMLCFAYGAMSADDVQSVGNMLAIGIWALPGMVTTTLWQQFYFSQKQTRTPLIVSVIQAVLIVPVLWIAQQHYGIAGVMTGFAIVQSMPFILYSVLARRDNALTQSVLGRDGMAMILVVILAYVPLAWLFRQLDILPITGLAVAIVMGVVLLMAAVLPSAQCRTWITTRVTTK